MDGKWYRNSERRVYESGFVDVDLVEIELPDKTTLDHHVVTVNGGEGAGMLAYDPSKGVLLLWRHRFITGEWGWELPGGAVDGKESPKQAATREFEEETGWKATKVTSLFTFHRMSGAINDTCHVFLATETEFVGPGRDTNEAADIAWLTLEQIKTAIQKSEVTDSMTVTSLLYAMQFGPLAAASDS